MGGFLLLGKKFIKKPPKDKRERLPFGGLKLTKQN